MLIREITILLFVVGSIAMPAVGGPLNIRIDDHDFTFDVPYSSEVNWGALWEFNGSDPDTLSIQSADPNHYVVSYSYLGKLPTVAPVPYGNPPAVNPFPYPVLSSNVFGGSLKMEMEFTENEGPFVNSQTNERFDINLVGNTGSLTIIGKIHNPVLPLPQIYPDPNVWTPQDPNDQNIVLLDIEFTELSLLSKVNSDSIYLIEGSGRVNTLLGHEIGRENELLSVGVTMFKFWAENPQLPIFTNPNYQPSDNVFGSIVGRISGEAGVIPEPATLLLLILGGLGLLRRRWR